MGLHTYPQIQFHYHFKAYLAGDKFGAVVVCGLVNP